MKHANEYERLAKLTGLPDLGTISDPDRLERLVSAARSSLAHCTRRCPLRFKIAYTQYAEAAQDRLENPEQI
jgi:hypothetical protein